MAIAGGTDTLLSEEQNSLVRVRLRATTLLLAVGLTLLQLRDALVVVDGAWQLQVAAILALAFFYSLLSFPGSPSGRRLKDAEITIFGIAATALAIGQYHMMISWAARGDEASFVVTAKNTIIGSIILMFVYAMLRFGSGGHRSCAAESGPQGGHQWDSRVHGPRTGTERSAARSPLRPVRAVRRRLALAYRSSALRG